MKKAPVFLFFILTLLCTCLLGACVSGASFLSSTAANGDQAVPAFKPVPMQTPAAKPAKLGAFTISHAQLAPAFSPDIYAYTAGVPYYTDEIDIQFTPQDASLHTTLTFNGAEQKTGILRPVCGSNVLRVDIQNQQGQTQSYTITLYREKPADPGRMSPLEKRFVETAMRLLPERNPFVLAYQEAHGVKINSYSKTVNGVRVSGVPFRYGGNGHIIGYDEEWWTRSGDRDYPANGMDCAEFMHWIYHNMGYEIPSDSASIFFAGVTGVERFTPGINRTHLVIPSLPETKIGDIIYNSEKFTYVSGKGSHVGMFLGTARKLGIAETLTQYYPDFPADAYLYIDIGWADTGFYLDELHSIGINGHRLFGTGIQFYPSVKGNDGKFIYESPYRDKKTRIQRWKDDTTGMTFEVTSEMEKEGRPFQHKPDKAGTVQYILNIARPIVRND